MAASDPRESDFWWRWSESMPRRLRDLLRRRFIRFLFVGGINAVFGYSVFAILILSGVPYPLASLFATIAGVLFNFKSYGAMVFGRHDNVLLFRFIAVYGVCYVLGLVLLAWAKANGHSLLLVAALALLPMAAISFLLNRLFVFGAPRS